MKAILLFIFAINIWSLQAQTHQTVSAGGGQAVVGEYQMEWTIGQVEAGMITGNDFVLTQGFLQPFVLGTSLEAYRKIAPEFVLFPNPTSQIFYISVSNLLASNIEIQIFDILGKKVWYQHYDHINDYSGFTPSYSQSIPVNCQNLGAGVYQVLIHCSGQKPISKNLPLIIH